MSSDKMERRFAEIREVRESEGDFVIEGIAAPFDSWADLGFFRERFQRGAFTDAIGSSDVKMLLNHTGLPLARNKSGTLYLDETDEGLFVRARLSREDPDVKRVIPKVERGDLSQWSIGFRLKRDGQQWSEGGKERTITRVDALFDVSLVTEPAYADTKVLGFRSLELYRAEVDETHVRETMLREVFLKSPRR